MGTLLEYVKGALLMLAVAACSIVLAVMIAAIFW